MTARLVPVSRTELMRRFQKLGFEGPFSGGKHGFMVPGPITVRVPNPHGSDIDVGLLKGILIQTGLSADEWLSH